MSETLLLKLLLVEANELDSVFLRNLLSSMTRLRPQMSWVRSGEEARRVVQAQALDLILADVLTCDAATLRSFPAAVPVVLLGAEPPSDHAGDASYLVKERLDANALESAVRLALRQPRHQPPEAQGRLQMALDALSSNIAVLDETGTITAVNSAWRRFSATHGGLEGTSGVGVNYLEVCRQASAWTPEAAEVTHGILDVIRGRRQIYERQDPCHDAGERRWFRLRVSRLGDGSPLRVLVVHENVTGWKLATEVVFESQERFCRLAEGASDLIWTARLDLRLTYVNKRIEGITGLSVKEAQKRSFIGLLTEESFARLGRTVAVELSLEAQKDIDPLRTFALDLELKTQRRATTWIHATLGFFRDEEGRPQGLQGLCHHITEDKKADAGESPHDPLTGLANRRHFLKRLEQAIHLAKRYQEPLSLCLCDIDYFESIKQSYGRLMGDRVLRGFGELLAAQLRAPDLAGRYEGGEFCALLVNTIARDAARAMARLRKKTEVLTFEADDGRPVKASVTCGIADLEPQHKDHRDLIQAAEKTLRRAKDMGINQVAIAETTGHPKGSEPA